MRKRIRKWLLLIFILTISLELLNCLVTSSVTVRSERKSNPPQTDKPKVMLSITVENPQLLVIPGTYVYWYDAGDSDVFFYAGLWWRYWEGNWYRASHYHGNWVMVEIKTVPLVIIKLPTNWKGRMHRAPRVSYYEARDNWQSWENSRYWEKRGWE